MAELTIGQLIKIILGVLVVVAVVAGIYLFFQYNVIDFFKGLGGEPEQESETEDLVHDGCGDLVRFEVVILDRDNVFCYGGSEHGYYLYTIINENQKERDDGRIYVHEGDKWNYSGPGDDSGTVPFSEEIFYDLAEEATGV